MVWLNILDNESILLAAETLFIIIGSMLMGILLGYLYWGNLQKKIDELTANLDEDKKQGEALREQVRELSQIRSQLQSEISDIKTKADNMAKTIYDQSQNLYSREAEFKHQKATIDTLNSTIDSYQHRLRIIEEELEQVKVKETKPRKSSTPSAVSANYEHVSKLLGKQVTDNDLTLIIGIGPKTAALLQSQGLQTWEELAAVTQEHLRKILSEAGGIYKTQDPTHWAKQALMASQGEWRKLRVFQETLRKVE